MLQLGVFAVNEELVFRGTGEGYGRFVNIFVLVKDSGIQFEFFLQGGEVR